MHPVSARHHPHPFEDEVAIGAGAYRRVVELAAVFVGIFYKFAETFDRQRFAGDEHLLLKRDKRQGVRSLKGS